MVMFESEADLLETIAHHDALVRQCVTGELSFLEFCEKYKDFYVHFALDGHESDEEERSLLEKHDNLIEPHRVIAYEILGQVCLLRRERPSQWLVLLWPCLIFKTSSLAII